MRQKIIILLILILVGAGALFLMPGADKLADEQITGGQASSSSISAQTTSEANTTEVLPEVGEPTAAEDEIQPAHKAYASASQALEAIKKGGAEYDDIVLEQFRLPGEECTWCGSLYTSLADLLKQPGLKPDQVLYYGQILALSGRPENLQVLADLVAGTSDEDAKEHYAQALEFTIGGPNVVTWLGEQMRATDERLQEAAIAALTNQNSRQAAELIYKRTVERDNPNEFYEVGIGLGEFIPEEEALPYLQDLFLKRDKFSPLAVKALLNGGLPGVRIVAEALMSSNDTAGDKALLDGAVEHVILDEPTIEFLHQVPNNTTNQALIDWVNASLTSDAGAEEEVEE